MHKLIIISGPTSSGKTSTALQLCKQYGGVIFSADSRQIYKHMNIGTNKIPAQTPPAEIQTGDTFWTINDIEVWGYDLVLPGEYFSAYDYAKFAIPNINKLLKKSNVFLVGGTGFYIANVVGDISPAQVPPDTQLRAKLETQEADQLHKTLTSLNLKRAKTIDPKNKRRLIRAIEIAMHTGSSNKPQLPHLEVTDIPHFTLYSSRESMYAKTDTWVDSIWGSLLEETRNLIDMGYEDTPQLNSLVYKTAKTALQQPEMSEESKQRTKYDLHHYIRRQQTWFNKQEGVIQLNTEDSNFAKPIENLLK